MVVAIAGAVLTAAVLLALGFAATRLDDSGGSAGAVGHKHLADATSETAASKAEAGHAAMIGDAVPAPGGPHDLDTILYPPKALPYKPGRVREFTVTAYNRDIEVAKGVTFPAWTFDGTVPGPTFRATEGDRVRIHLRNRGTEPHTIHLHGIHPANQDGVFEIVPPGEDFTYEFIAKPGALQVYHCHATPLKKHIHRGLYGTFIIDPKEGRPPAKELVMVMNGFDTDGDSENNFYTVNGKAFYYAKYPIKVRQGERIRIYLSNMTEFDQINSFHLHGNFFRYYATGSTDTYEHTDMITQAQGERGVIETAFPYPGRYMFHAHQAEFADLGWMGFFEVLPDGTTPKGQAAADTERAFDFDAYKGSPVAKGAAAKGAAS